MQLLSASSTSPAHFRRSLWIALASLSVHSVSAQDITMFFRAGDLSGAADRFGNTHTVGPATAIESRAFGSDDLVDVAFDQDNKWLIYGVEGNTFLLSNAPGGLEDSPEIAMNITVAIGGKFEVLLNFLDSQDLPGSGPIQAALGENALIEYSELNATRATGGTSPGFPLVDGTTTGVMWWQSVSLGEVEVAKGEVVKVRIDDVPSGTADPWVTSSFQGVTLRAIELAGAISEIQVSPGVFEWTTDVSGNQFKTGPQASNLTQEQWLTVNANSSGDNLWNIRQKLGSYGPILESFPTGGEDAPTLQTSVIFAKTGIYKVFFSLGDTGAVNPDENLTTQTPLNFAFEGEEFTRWHANDGEFKGTPGYNDYEMAVGEIYARAGQVINFLIDDVQDGTATRSVYLGMRFEYLGGSNPFQITAVNRTNENFTLHWTPLQGKFYAVDTSSDLIHWQSLITEYPAGGASGDSVSFTDSSAPQDTSAARYYRVRQVPPPPLLLADFENGADGWTATTDSGDTLWELGTPAIADLTTGSSGTQAWGTNLDGNYTPDTLARLRSPVIDLASVKSPVLSFNYYIDSTFEAEGGQLRFLSATGDPLAVIDDIFSGKSDTWTPYSIKIPEAALNTKVIVEFAFLSDPDDSVGAGWYIDDVKID